MHRFYVAEDQILGEQVRFSKTELHHIEKVLRLMPDDEIIIFDGSGKEYLVVLKPLAEGELGGIILQQTVANREPVLKINLVQAIAKGEKMDLIIQKAVELGVSKITPVLTDRTVVKLFGDKAEKKQQRWQSIAREACKQCRRNQIPEVFSIINLGEYLNDCTGETGIMLYETEPRQPIRTVFDNLKANIMASGQLNLLVGPEGGFSPPEAELAQRNGFVLTGLGPRILRTETAALVALSILFYESGDLD
ncbi:MAG: 16S rRNA (uracil(1498)-N(3))-methyltransferase [Syntrophomonadaceae bacterium]|nr:16S rRNA (uracil(1498)-N(3))-methyltransferase [Syntrophomonadaceae bacterium]